MALIGIKIWSKYLTKNLVTCQYPCEYSDQTEDMTGDGYLPVPDDPGLGVSYDWEYIDAHRTQHFTFE